MVLLLECGSMRQCKAVLTPPWLGRGEGRGGEEGGDGNVWRR